MNYTSYHIKYIIALLMCFAMPNTFAAQLNIVSPTENQTYTVGSTLNITYVFLDVDTVKIEVFSPTNGGIWEIVADSFPTSRATTIPVTNLSSPDWAHYQIRITDFNGVADTAYSGYFSVLNPTLPTLQLNVVEPNINVGNTIKFNWDISPSVDSLKLQMQKPNRKTWENVITNYKTTDSTATFYLPDNYPGGTYYFRAYDVSNPTKYSNLDSLHVVDNVFAGIDVLSPNEGAEQVDIFLNNNAFNHAIWVDFKEAVNLVSGKIIDIYNETGGLVTSLPTDSPQVYLQPNNAGDSTILVIEPQMPLQHSAHYYVLMDVGLVNDKAGNPFAGLQSPTDWAFNTVEMNTFSGIISYDGNQEGNLIVDLFTQNDVEDNELGKPVNFVWVSQPTYPNPYSIGVPNSGEFGVFCYIDLNSNFLYDLGEPSAFKNKIRMNAKDTSGIDLTLKDAPTEKPYFSLDLKKSYWGNNKKFSFNQFVNAFCSGDLSTGLTPCTNHPKKIDDLLWRSEFWIYESNSLDLNGSAWDIGTTLHLEYTHADTLQLNAIAAGAKINGMRNLPGRLILNIEVINPIESLNGDLDAACGILISCSPAHTNGLNAHGSMFYGNFDINTLSFASYAQEDLVGLKISGKNGVEGELMALLSDSFLINLSSQFNPTSMPENSSMLRGLIPELAISKYVVANSANVIKLGFDTDGNGSTNGVYPVSIKNSNWSIRRLLFGAEKPNDIIDESYLDANISYHKLSNSLRCNHMLNNVRLFDISGKSIKSFNTPNKRFELQEHMRPGIYLIQYEFKGKIRASKVLIR